MQYATTQTQETYIVVKYGGEIDKKDYYTKVLKLQYKAVSAYLSWFIPRLGRVTAKAFRGEYQYL